MKPPAPRGQRGRSRPAGRPEIRIAVEILFPTWLLLDCLDRFGAGEPRTRIEVIEIGAGPEPASAAAGTGRSRDLRRRFRRDSSAIRCCASARFRSRIPDHHAAPVAPARCAACDLRAYRHLVVAIPAAVATTRALSLESRAAVDGQQHVDVDPRRAPGLRLRVVPRDQIRDELKAGTLKPLPLSEGVERFGEALPDSRRPRRSRSPARCGSAEIIREGVAAGLRKAAGGTGTRRRCHSGECHECDDRNVHDQRPHLTHDARCGMA